MHFLARSPPVRNALPADKHHSHFGIGDGDQNLLLGNFSDAGHASRPSASLRTVVVLSGAAELLVDRYLYQTCLTLLPHLAGQAKPLLDARGSLHALAMRGGYCILANFVESSSTVLMMLGDMISRNRGFVHLAAWTAIWVALWMVLCASFAAAQSSWQAEWGKTLRAAEVEGQFALYGCCYD
jgi:hypothetical protein